jgi:hypothetical protein
MIWVIILILLTLFCIKDEKIHLTPRSDQSSIIETGPLDIKL